jgi:hypothetical protein
VRFLRLPRINTKREVWPGGPKLGEVIEAQLSPSPNAQSGAEPASDDAAAPPAESTSALNLLLLLR